jgi:hypothetical protein
MVDFFGKGEESRAAATLARSGRSPLFVSRSFWAERVDNKFVSDRSFSPLASNDRQSACTAPDAGQMGWVPRPPD